MGLHLMEEEPGSAALLEKRSDVTDYCFIIMRSIVAQEKMKKSYVTFFII